jgi:predicted nucleotidyltransferase
MDAVFNNNAYRVLELFMEHPQNHFSARGIARELKLSHATVLKFLKELERLSLISRDEQTLYPTFYANRMGNRFMFYMKNHTLFEIRNSGVIRFIRDSLLPTTIILFGSAAKGDFRENSDIDLFVEAAESDLDLDEFEKKLKHKIHVQFEPKIENLTKELASNILNGTVLDGFVDPWPPKSPGKHASPKE